MVLTRLWSEILAAGKRTNECWIFIQSKRVRRMHLLTDAQLEDLVNLPGEVS